MPLEMRILLVGRVLASNAQIACPQCQHQEAKASLGHESTSKREEEKEERRRKKGGGEKKRKQRGRRYLSILVVVVAGFWSQHYQHSLV